MPRLGKATKASIPFLGSRPSGTALACRNHASSHRRNHAASGHWEARLAGQADHVFHRLAFRSWQSFATRTPAPPVMISLDWNVRVPTWQEPFRRRAPAVVMAASSSISKEPGFDKRQPWAPARRPFYWNGTLHGLHFATCECRGFEDPPVAHCRLLVGPLGGRPRLHSMRHPTAGSDRVIAISFLLDRRPRRSVAVPSSGRPLNPVASSNLSTARVA
jgi:hypothetical protein